MTRHDTLLLVLQTFALSLRPVPFRSNAPATRTARGVDLAVAMVYVDRTVYWTWLLSRVLLLRAYPFVALRFLFVPLMARLFCIPPGKTRLLSGAVRAFSRIGISAPGAGEDRRNGAT